MKRSRDKHGVVLLVVLFFALLLSSSIATFLSRSSVDAIIARNRENGARADALARGGVRLAQALLLEDRLLEEAAGAIRRSLELVPRNREARELEQQLSRRGF